VETFLWRRMVGAESQREEQALQRERQKREALEKELSRWRPRNRGYLAHVPWGA